MDRKLSAYVNSLGKDEKQRYLHKLQLQDLKIELPDPYVLKGWANNIKAWPNLNNGHIHYYLVERTNGITGEKNGTCTLDGYNYFKSGHVHAVLYHPVEKNSPVCFLRSKVIPSQKLSNKAYEPWVCLQKTDGFVLSAHCTCMAGLSEVCSHITALLYKIEAAVSLGFTTNDASTSKLSVLNRCYRSKIQPAPLDEIDFTHHRRAKSRKKATHPRPEITPMSESEKENALAELRKILPNAAVFEEGD